MSVVSSGSIASSSRDRNREDHKIETSFCIDPSLERVVRRSLLVIGEYELAVSINFDPQVLLVRGTGLRVL